jgi:hypothetical protein
MKNMMNQPFNTSICYVLAILLGLMVFLPAGLLGSSETQLFTHPISPVYEKMVAGHIESFRRHCEKTHLISPREEWIITGWTEADKVLASEIISSIWARNPLERKWQYTALIEGESFRGMLLLSQWRHSLDAAADFTKNNTDLNFIVLFAENQNEADEIKNRIRPKGLHVLDETRERELEYVKDGSGRQMFDLDLMKHLSGVFERLVFEGVNPAGAWSQVGAAIQTFRSNLDRIILVVGKGQV